MIGPVNFKKGLLFPGSKGAKAGYEPYEPAWGRHFCKKLVDGYLPQRYSRHVSQETTGFGDSDKEADNRHQAVFFRPYIAVPSMGGSGGDTFGYAGSFLPVRQPRHLPPPRLATGSGLTAQEGGTHA